MDGQNTSDSDVGQSNLTVESVAEQARQRLEQTLLFCQQFDGPFLEFERRLAVLVAELGRLLIGLFLLSRHQRLKLGEYLRDGFQVSEAAAARTLKTIYGKVTYVRAYLYGGGKGFHPLDAVLGLTRDSFSPWVIQFVTRLATRMSFAASRQICKAALGWSPSTEAIEELVLGLGRQAAPFVAQQTFTPAADEEVLVIEVDGKCPPTATEEELRKRRGKRRGRSGCPCGCQRHRGKAKRKARGSKKRRKKGDKSKNGREAIVVVIYTLRRGPDGKLHGPVGKKVWGTFAGRKAAAQWARAAATRRGFGPDTTKTVQIVVDGAKGLRQNLQRLFPKAIITLDICHVVEKLWTLGRHFHPEASEALKEWVDELKALLYAGQAKKLLSRLRRLLKQVPRHGPGTKARRKALERLIGYLKPRLRMMRYGEWIARDLVIATGQVEGAVRHLVGERLDCAGMRWIPGRAEALLQLRCIELNGDWIEFIDWNDRQNRERLARREVVQTRSNQPLDVKKAA
jgi:hypothetical protein